MVLGPFIYMYIDSLPPGPITSPVWLCHLRREGVPLRTAGWWCSRGGVQDLHQEAARIQGRNSSLLSFMKKFIITPRVEPWRWIGASSNKGEWTNRVSFDAFNYSKGNRILLLLESYPTNNKDLLSFFILCDFILIIHFNYQSSVFWRI